ncbi:SDR family NAD(P)-dependent oxidoreductase [Sulfitobacter sp.]|uniref:SDR family NAD(P)-dependent oxidoreductase n=1 Tax=Sulfitobacter sp. TaxID=1903071 RepID=UPI0035651187
MDTSTYVIGQACRLPGAKDAKAFRSLLREGKCSVTSVPQDRWNHDLFLHPKPGTQGKSYTFAAGVLDDIWGFDLSAFNLSPREVILLDPQQRLLMQVVFEALEDAHIDPASLAGQRVGVYVGASSMDHGTILGRDPSLTDAYMMTGNTLSLVANRISHAFDLRGPSFVVDTACSSSLVALDVASKALSSGEIDTAIVGGVNLLLNPSSFVGFSAAHMLSQVGRCQSFSDSADGYVRAEGCVAVVLQRSDVVPRRARAVVLDTDVNADGQTMNVALPSEEGQFSLLSGLYQRAGLDPNALSFIEAHGTGTLVGDPIEARALSRAIAQQRDALLPIGSSKSNVGHLEPASGLVGLLKTLVAFEDRVLPASLHAGKLNPNIDFDALNLVVVRDALKLPETGTLLAGVSSFGFGGVNAHCIVQSVEAPAEAAGPVRQDRLVVTSAFCEGGLKELAAAYAEKSDHPQAFCQGGLVDQMWAGRGLHQKRLAVLADGAEAMKEALQAFAKGQPDHRLVQVESRRAGLPTVFAYSGNGAQYGGMCRLALETDPTYRRVFERIDAEFNQIAGWSLMDSVNGDALTTPSGDIAQCLLFADQIAQTESLAEKGLKPAAVMGHSGGEIAAAHASGALSLGQAVSLIVHRCANQKHIQGKGSMAALQAGAAEAEAALAVFDHADPDFPIAIAAINSARSVTLTGPKPELQRFGKWVRKTYRFACVQLDLDSPYHSVLLDPYEAQFRHALGDFQPSDALVRYFSCTRGYEVAGADLGAGYWCDNLRQPVLFQSAVESAIAAGFDCFLEIGASPVLASYISDSAKAATGDVVVTRTLSKTDPKGVNPVARAFARAVLSGCAFDESKSFAPLKGPAIDLPRYPWQNTQLRATDSPEIQRQLGLNSSYHTLLGASVASDIGVWRRDLDEHVIPALKDHKLGETVLLPATAMAEMAIAAARQVSGNSLVEITDLDLVAPVILSGGQGIELQMTANRSTGQIALHSRARFSQEPFRENMRARFSVLSTAPTPPSARAPLPVTDAENRGRFIYENAARCGLNYGPAFQGIAAVRVGNGMAEVVLAEGLTLRPGFVPIGVDPVQMDCLLHGILEISGIGRGSDFDRAAMGFVPIRVERIKVFAPGEALSTGRIEVRTVGTKSALVDVTGFDADGQPVVCFEGLRLQASFLLAPVEFDQHAYHVTARPILPCVAALDDGAVVASIAQAVTPQAEADDSNLLLTAATHQAIWSVMREHADDDGVYKIAHPQHRAEQTLLGMLAALDLAVPDDVPDQWHLSKVSELPESNDIAHGLLEERPDLVSDLSVLLRLPDALRQVLATGAGALPEPETLYGREALKTLGNMHPKAARILRIAVKGLIGSVPCENRVRVGVVGHDLSALHAVQGSHPGLEIVEIRRPSFEGASEQTEFASVPWDSAAGFDIVVVLAPATLVKPDAEAWLRSAVNAGGAVLILNQSLPALAKAACVTTLHPADQAPRTERLQQRYEQHLGVPMQRFALPDDAAGGDLLLARLPAAATDDEIDLASGADPWLDVWQSLYGPCQTAWHSLEQVTPADDTAPVLVKRSQGAKATLAESLLCLKAVVLEAAQAGRPVIVALPNGAQFHGAQPADPEQFALWCSLRTISNEYPALKITVIDACDLDDATGLLKALRALARSAPAETEIVLRSDTTLGLRVELGLPKPAPGRASDEDTSLTLACLGSRRLNGLSWQQTRRAKLGANEVEVEVAATGLNYRDVMWALGLLPEEALEAGFVGATLGLECAGKVVRVGADVSKVAVGDPVIAFGPSSFGTHLVIEDSWVTAVPPDLPLDQAATLPVSYFTAQYALDYLARLGEGETVLIHGGAGGVGLAAIAVAQRVGARVIATAGSPVKQNLLAELGVDHVLSSRDMVFVSQIREITDGRGLDVVLNSLAGPAMEASLGLLRPYGRFLELGKQDYYANTSVGLRALKDNISYHGIDVDSLLADRPEIAKAVLKDVMAHVADGQYPPLPMTVFEAEDVAEAFRLMQRSGQIGKVVVTPPNVGSLASSEPAQSPMFMARPDGWHVIAGGLGGLGFEWAEILRQRGAKRLALLSRSGNPADDVATRIEKLRSDGAEVRIIACDITNKPTLLSALDALRRDAPLAGVYHTAMVLEDRRLQDIDAAYLDQVLTVKTLGTDNLDRATRSDDLQAFVAFTSLATLVGNIGQSAYVAANAYQEAVIKRRVADGLAGLAVGFGAITDVGYVARDEALSKMLYQVTGKLRFPAAVALGALTRLLEQPLPDPCVTLTQMGWASALGQLSVLGHPSHERLHRLAVSSGQGQNSGTLRADLLTLSHAKAVKRTTEFLKAEIAGILRVSAKSLSSTRPLAEYGMDSLMGVELGLATQDTLGDDLPMSALGDDSTIEGIATMLVDHIKASGGAQ